MKPYKASSSIIKKVGQLVAAIHLKLVCKALRKIVRNESFVKIVGHGLSQYMDVMFSEEPLQVDVSILTDSRNFV